MLAQQRKQIGLFGRQLGRFVFYGQDLFLQVEFEFSEKLNLDLFLVLRPVTALYRLHTGQQDISVERFAYHIVRME